MDPVTMAVIGSAVAGLVGTGMSNAKAAREAEKNREFQREMSNTAHQREVRDLMAAGLHPALSAQGGSGASSPSGAVAPVHDMGDAVGRSVASALAIKQMKSNIDLTQAQAAAANAAGQLSNAQAGDIVKRSDANLSLTQAQVAVANADLNQRRAMMPDVLRKAMAEADSAQARAKLENLSLAGAKNVATFEKEIGAYGPWSRLLLEIIRSTK